MAKVEKIRLPKGVIFDMDGVLVDSEPFILRAGLMMFAERGLAVKEEDFLPYIGAGEDRFVGGVAEKYGVDYLPERDKKRTYDIYLDIIKGELSPLKGVHEFIGRCRAMGKKIGVASSADLRKVRGNLEEISIGFEQFDVVLTSEDVKHKKPDPEIFLLAAKRMGLAASECLVIEDAVNGVAAAKAAGAKCLGILSSFSHEELEGADWLAKDLTNVPAEVLDWGCGN